MITINHLALYCSDLEAMRLFYEKYFEARSNSKYTNVNKGFNSYFLSFGVSPVRLELMTKKSVIDGCNEQHQERLGLTHFALSVGSPIVVDDLTERLRIDGYRVAGEPRRTGDGYYESVVLDPEGNRIEIVG